ATGRQALTPESVQLELLPQPARDPAGAPLSWPLQTEFRQAHLDRLRELRRELALQGKQRQLPERLSIGIEHLDGFDPRGPLAVVDFAQIQNGPLHPLALGAADFFNNAPVT